MLKIVDIGIYAAAPDYGELIKVHAVPLRFWKMWLTATCRAS